MLSLPIADQAQVLDQCLIFALKNHVAANESRYLGAVWFVASVLYYLMHHSPALYLPAQGHWQYPDLEISLGVTSMEKGAIAAILISPKHRAWKALLIWSSSLAL